MNQCSADIVHEVLARHGANPYMLFGYGDNGYWHIPPARVAIDRALHRMQSNMRVQGLILFAPPLHLCALLAPLSHIDIDVYLGGSGLRATEAFEAMEAFARYGIVRLYKSCQFV